MENNEGWKFKEGEFFEKTSMEGKIFERTVEGDLEWIDYLHQSLWKLDKESVKEILDEQKNYYDFSYRIVRENDNHYMITADLKPNRINLEFENNYLTKSYLG